ncbi:hypothetical protein Tco_1401902 [Tanacetum coccineum]
MSTLRFRIGMVEAENASLCGKIKTMEAIEMVTRSQEKRACMEMERILQVILDLQHFKSSLFIFSATTLQSSSAIHHISNNDNMYIKSYSFSLLSSLPAIHSGSRSVLWPPEVHRQHGLTENPFALSIHETCVCSRLVNPISHLEKVNSMVD